MARTQKDREFLVARATCICQASNSITGVFLPFVDENAIKFNSSMEINNAGNNFDNFLKMYFMLSATSAYIVIQENKDPGIDEFIAMLPDYGNIKQLLFITNADSGTGISELTRTLDRIGIKCVYNGRSRSTEKYASFFTPSLKPKDLPQETLISYARDNLNKELARFQTSASIILSGRGCNLTWLASQDFINDTEIAFRNLLVTAKRCTKAESETEIKNTIGNGDKVRSDGLKKIATMYEDSIHQEFTDKMLFLALPEPQKKMLDAAKAIASMYERSVENNLKRDLTCEQTIKFLNDYASDNAITEKIMKLAKGYGSDDVL